MTNQYKSELPCHVSTTSRNAVRNNDIPHCNENPWTCETRTKGPNRSWKTRTFPPKRRPCSSFSASFAVKKTNWTCPERWSRSRNLSSPYPHPPWGRMRASCDTFYVRRRRASSTQNFEPNDSRPSKSQNSIRTPTGTDCHMVFIGSATKPFACTQVPVGISRAHTSNWHKNVVSCPECLLKWVAGDDA